MPPHLVIPGLGEQHFRCWLTLFRATVSRICPPDVAALFMERALRIAHSFRLAIAFNRGENTVGVKPILDKACDVKLSPTVVVGRAYDGELLMRLTNFSCYALRMLMSAASSGVG